MISEKTINQIKELPVEDVVGNYLALKKSGATWKASCPFHNEKSASFTIFPKTDSFKCFGCGAGGDGIRFVMLHEKQTFAEALETIANKHNIMLEYTAGEAPKPEEKEKKLLRYKVMQSAANKYADALQSDNYAMQYLLAKRELKPQTIKLWNIGYAPSEYKFLTSKIIEKNLFDVAESVGIVRQKEGKVYDFFRHRIVIPIENRNGDVVSFGGRKLPNDNSESPKYLNTSNTEIYDKSKIIFGLPQAIKSIRETDTVILVEGYLDVIRLHECNWSNAVATCGTSLTEEHAKLLRKHAKGIVIMRDGDKAGRNAVARDIQILIKHFNNIKVAWLPEGHDPDSYFLYVKKTGFSAVNFITFDDAIEWQLHQWFQQGSDIVMQSAAIECAAEMLQHLKDNVQRDMYIAQFSKEYKFKETLLKKPLQEKMQEVTGSLFPDDELPPWVDVKTLYTDGFVMKRGVKGESDKDRIGIYFKTESKPVTRLTNYVVKPLYLVMDALNSRRMIEVYNGVRNSVIELPSRAFTSQDAFETEIIARGAYYSEPGFGKPQYKRLANWLTENMMMVHELKTLGWQPEGFFAFSNKIIVPGKDIIAYDDYGIAKVDDHAFLSPGVSKINVDVRAEDNIYENDLYLKHQSSPITFKEWADMFFSVYDEHAPFGMAFIFISAFKDIVTKTTKCPLAYFFGPKGSGKSAMAESMMWFFFSGKNAEGKLIQGYNLNPGQGTPFSFFSRLQRFRNVFMLYNEYDPNTVEFWKKGAFKSAYDGEGREVGSGDTGKKRKTEIQKVQCVPGIAGQYLDTTDDGSVLSRSVIFKFSLEKNKQRTDEQKKLWEKLNDLEHKGISSLAADLYKYRDIVAKNLKDIFWTEQSRMNKDLRKRQVIAEARILNNYSLCLAVMKIMSAHLEMPFDYNHFYTVCLNRCLEHARLISDNNVLKGFWNTIEILVSDGILRDSYHFKISDETSLRVKTDNKVDSILLPEEKKVVYIQMKLLHDKFAKRYREIHNKVAPDVDTLVTYLKDQPYYLGMCPSVRFKQTNTSAYMVDYSGLEDLGINLIKWYVDESEAVAENEPQTPKTPENEKPFEF